MSEGFEKRWRIVYVDDVDSTQEEAKRRLRSGEALDRTVLRALRQRAGRGRRGRTFVSAAGGSYQSLVVRDVDGRWRTGGVTLALSAGVAEAFEARRVAVRLKWPNDLLDAQGRKCGGLLAEHAREHLIVGVGVNAEDAPEEFGAVGAPLATVHDAVLEGVERGLLIALDPDRLAAAFAPWDALAGRTVTVERAGDGERVVGVARGVAADGALRVATRAGPVVRVTDGSVREVDPPLA